MSDGAGEGAGFAENLRQELDFRREAQNQRIRRAGLGSAARPASQIGQPRRTDNDQVPGYARLAAATLLGLRVVAVSRHAHDRPRGDAT